VNTPHGGKQSCSVSANVGTLPAKTFLQGARAVMQKRTKQSSGVCQVVGPTHIAYHRKRGRSGPSELRWNVWVGRARKE